MTTFSYFHTRNVIEMIFETDLFYRYEPNKDHRFTYKNGEIVTRLDTIYTLHKFIDYIVFYTKEEAVWRHGITLPIKTQIIYHTGAQSPTITN